jgi:hypothetical protein
VDGEVEWFQVTCKHQNSKKEYCRMRRYTSPRNDNGNFRINNVNNVYECDAECCKCLQFFNVKIKK